MFGTVTASVTAALYYAARIGFENPAGPLVAALGLSLFITVAPFLAWLLSSGGQHDEPHPWWGSQPFFMLAALLLSALTGLSVPLIGTSAGWILAAMGYGAAIAAIAIWVMRGKPASNLFFVAGAAVFAVWTCGQAWSTNYKNPAFWETLEYRGGVHPDVLYFASIANNIRTYGVPSTGLDGLPYTPYHYGSQWLLSQWASLTGTDVLAFYTLGPSVIVIPLFFCALLLLAVEVKNGWSETHPEATRPLRTNHAAWLLFFAATVGVIPASGLEHMGIRNRYAMVSESYVIAIPVFLLVMSTAVLYWRRRTRSFRGSDLVFLLAFAPTMVAVSGFLKVSTMVLLLAAALGVALLKRLFRNRVFALSALLCLSASVVTYKLVSVAAQNQGINPFSYMRFYANPAWWPYFLLVHVFWSWLYIYLRLREEKVVSIGDVRQAALEGRLTDTVVVAIVAVAGWAPGEVINIQGGSAFYFSDVQRWLALSLLMAWTSRWLAWHPAAREGPGRRAITFGGMRLSRIWLVGLAIPISVTMLLNIVRSSASALRTNVTLRRALYAEAGITGPAGIRSLADPLVLDAGLHRSPDYALISTLRSLYDTPAAIKRRTAVFIPQSYAQFWRIWADPTYCSFAPLIVPATSGLALIDGMPPADCDLTAQYNMARYTRRTTLQLPTDVMPYALCAKAKAKGFSRIVEIDGPDSSRVSVRVIECPIRIAAPPRVTLSGSR